MWLQHTTIRLQGGMDTTDPQHHNIKRQLVPNHYHHSMPILMLAQVGWLTGAAQVEKLPWATVCIGRVFMSGHPSQYQPFKLQCTHTHTLC